MANCDTFEAKRETMDSGGNKGNSTGKSPNSHTKVNYGDGTSESVLEVITPRRNKGKERQRSPTSSVDKVEEETLVLLSPERKLYQWAIVMCKHAGLSSPRNNHQLYSKAQEMAVEALEGMGVRSLDERSEGFSEAVTAVLREH